MSPTLAELMNALPKTDTMIQAVTPIEALSEPLTAASMRPVPVGWLRRAGILGTLQARIGAAYMFLWIRGWFQTSDERTRQLAETHWQTALRVLDSMSYLRGAVMKFGQTLANFPDIAPREFVETLNQLHFNAPPMHWTLLKEMVARELGDDPENLFAWFDKRAFAAASLGQVHRARLKSGEEVAVKIQYPGIARTIGEDFRNLQLFLLPARLGKDWDNVKDQFDELRTRLELETDYDQEASALERARGLFRDDDGIVVPRVYRQYSTSRVLTMEYLPGVHLDEFMTRNPTQELRNEYGRKLVRGWYRLMFAGRLVYADFHPGNFVFMDDGRLGIIDFGFLMPLDDDLWELFRKIDRPLTTGDRNDRIAVMKEWCWITDDAANDHRVQLMEEWADWSWRSRYCGGAFDFGDEADFRRGVDLFLEMVRKRYSRARTCTPILSRSHFGWRAMLYRLKATFDVRPIAEVEVRVCGWDRGDYLPKP